MCTDSHALLRIVLAWRRERFEAAHAECLAAQAEEWRLIMQANELVVRSAEEKAAADADFEVAAARSAACLSACTDCLLPGDIVSDGCPRLSVWITHLDEADAMKEDPFAWISSRHPLLERLRRGEHVEFSRGDGRLWRLLPRAQDTPERWIEGLKWLCMLQIQDGVSTRARRRLGSS
jgi:hypothetical protein